VFVWNEIITKSRLSVILSVKICTGILFECFRLKLRSYFEAK
jgi:hypothetical protein